MTDSIVLSVQPGVGSAVDGVIRASGPGRLDAARQLERLGRRERGRIGPRGSLAASATSRLPGPELESKLLQVLKDDEPAIRSMIALGLAEWGGVLATGAIAGLLGNERDAGARLAFVTALGQLGGREAAVALSEALSDSDETIRLSAIGAIEALASSIEGEFGEPLMSASPNARPAGPAPTSVRARRIRGVTRPRTRTNRELQVEANLSAKLTETRDDAAAGAALRWRAGRLLTVLGV